jgi:predicted transglutaminase-like cysteine proteinase
MNALPALCAIAILSASHVRAESLNPDESQFTGWLHAISEMQDKPIRYHSRPIANFPQQLARINREINAYPYNGAFDAYWEKPSELRQLGGQCRDFAVAKYARLYDLGVADADMELTAVRIRKTGELHAVLVVRHHGHVYVLDNLRSEVQGLDRLKEFEPVYHINRIGWSRLH